MFSSRYIYARIKLPCCLTPAKFNSVAFFFHVYVCWAILHNGKGSLVLSVSNTEYCMFLVNENLCLLQLGYSLSYAWSFTLACLLEFKHSVRPSLLCSKVCVLSLTAPRLHVSVIKKKKQNNSFFSFAHCVRLCWIMLYTHVTEWVQLLANLRWLLFVQFHQTIVDSFCRLLIDLTQN